MLSKMGFSNILGYSVFNGPVDKTELHLISVVYLQEQFMVYLTLEFDINICNT